MPVICVTGAQAAELFYDQERFTRVGVVPKPVQKTLFGQGGVQGLDGPEHLVRKALFTSAVTQKSVEELADVIPQGGGHSETGTGALVSHSRSG